MLLERGDSLHAAEAQLLLAEARSRTGQDGWHGLVEEATTLLEGLPPGKELVAAYSGRASWEYVEGVPGDGIVWADKALVLGEQLGLFGRSTSFAHQGGSPLLRRRPLRARRPPTGRSRSGKNRGSCVMSRSHTTNWRTSSPYSRALRRRWRSSRSGIGVARLGGYATAAAEVEAITAPELLYDLGRWNELVRTSRASLEKTCDLDEMSRLCSRMFLAGAAPSVGTNSIWRRR